MILVVLFLFVDYYYFIYLMFYPLLKNKNIYNYINIFYFKQPFLILYNIFYSIFKKLYNFYFNINLINIIINILIHIYHLNKYK